MIDKFEMLIALAREKHFGRAAEACNVTQPSLSSAIRALEDTLGVPLVHRGARFIGLTPEGQKVLARARSIVAEARALRGDLNDLRHAPEGRLRLGVIPSALTAVTEITTRYLQRHPAVRLEVWSMTSQQISEALADFRIDAGVSYPADEAGRPAYPGFDALPFHCESWSVLIRADQAPARIGWDDLPGLRLCLLSASMQNRRLLDRAVAARGLDVVPILESDSLVALVSHVRAGLGATVLPGHPARFFADLPGMACLPLGAGGAAPIEVALVVPAEGRRGAALAEFVQLALSVGNVHRSAGLPFEPAARRRLATHRGGTR